MNSIKTSPTDYNIKNAVFSAKDLRTSKITDLILDTLKLNEDDNILEIGHAENLSSAYIDFTKFNYSSILIQDLFENIQELNLTNLEDTTNFFHNKKYNLVIVNSNIHTDVKKIDWLTNIFKILKPNGFFVFIEAQRIFDDFIQSEVSLKLINKVNSIQKLPFEYIFDKNKIIYKGLNKEKFKKI